MSAVPVASVVRALRPRQWVKNALVAAAPVAAGSIGERPVLLRTIVGVVAFTGAAGATYLVNDAADVEIDRAHPTKRMRPIAAGELSPAAARAIAVTLAAGSVLVASVLALSFGLVIVAYLAINAWYSAGMKHMAGVELAAIAAGFILRGIGGGAATDTPLSVWFVVVVCAASLFVVAGKRSAELVRTAGSGGRRVLAGYSSEGLRWLRAASATSAVIAYAIWVFAQDGANPWWAGVSLVPFTAALGRYSRVIEEGRGEDPEDVLLSDRAFQLLTLAWVVSYGVPVYV